MSDENHCNNNKNLSDCNDKNKKNEYRGLSILASDFPLFDVMDDAFKGGQPHVSYDKQQWDDYRGLSACWDRQFEVDPEKERFVKNEFDKNEIDYLRNVNYHEIDNIDTENTFDYDDGFPRCEIIYDDKFSINDHNNKEAKYFDPFFSSGQTEQIPESCEYTKKLIKGALSFFEDNHVADWCQDENDSFIFDGRIFNESEDVEFRCQIYQIMNDTSKCVLETSRMAGDSFLFFKFYTEFFSQLRVNQDSTGASNDVEIINNNYNSNNDDNARIFTNDSTNDIVLETKSLNLNDTHSHNDNYNEVNETQTIDKTCAKSLIQNATNSSFCREMSRSHIATLKCIVNDVKNAKIIADEENIFEHLLAPIVNSDPIPSLDCWIIKSLLEITLKLIPYSKSKCTISKIIFIQEQWAKHVDHPFGIARFIPSQQICWVCSEIIRTQQN